MASTREIQSRMKSIQDTMKITNAMYMISSSKLKRAKKRLEDTEPYFYMLQSAIARVLRHLPDMESPYFESFEKRNSEDKKIGYIVVTADKGLAGAYNHNVIKLAEEKLQNHSNHRLFVVGELGRQYFSKKGLDIDTSFHYTVQNPNMSRARIISEKIIDLYKANELDEVHMIFTTMENAVQTEAQVVQLLPLKKADFNEKKDIKIPIDVKMEEIALSPTAETVIDYIVPNYIAGFIYGALVESYSSEQNARMMAMQAATDSATKMLRELSIVYNRVRQAAITQEITEVISGAKAQKKKRKH
ncbi:ATP synthase F1 subunit gamma [Velocimicrobium porci]|uniref:ATP synthase gamma chain n=1 Tax=Velocimicrobium porci TaxID=2606634 RepID=A0A6L5Y3Q4_9FIRM|nr:ATP synthase F1 subunit gamma [Velocimicrobium porci]MSS64783.1 ATP synthase F1 subunit gamma [Velocimicrobium porci]